MENETKITEDMTFKGEIEFNGNLIVEGNIEGRVSSSGFIQVEKEGQITGDISVHEVLIKGKLHGNIHQASFVKLENTAHCSGDIETKELQIDKGGLHNGRTIMNR